PINRGAPGYLNSLGWASTPLSPPPTLVLTGAIDPNLGLIEVPTPSGSLAVTYGTATLPTLMTVGPLF
ncbi:MAG: hypothetical protein ACO4AJ_00050, partial [Prochlorothrix sp.]